MTISEIKGSAHRAFLMATAIQAKQAERERITQETFQAVQTLNAEFESKFREMFKSNDYSTLSLYEESKRVKEKTDALWAAARQKIAELG